MLILNHQNLLFWWFFFILRYIYIVELVPKYDFFKNQTYL